MHRFPLFIFSEFYNALFPEGGIWQVQVAYIPALTNSREQFNRYEILFYVASIKELYQIFHLRVVVLGLCLYIHIFRIFGHHAFRAWHG